MPCRRPDLTPEQNDAFWALTHTAVLAVLRRPSPPAVQAQVDRARVTRERQALEGAFPSMPTAPGRPAKRL